uniref:Uncharacterized protein n=1 Tax=Equus caballus TaxID=9796 RepID=A0A9L0QZA6_HORSE
DTNYILLQSTFYQGSVFTFYSCVQKASRCETRLSCAPGFITGCFLPKRGKTHAFPLLKKKCFLYLSRHHCTSELYNRLGGTGSLVETFHSSAAPFLAREASAPRSWRLGTAATGSPGLRVTTGSGKLGSRPCRWARRSRSLCICSLRNSSLAAREKCSTPG